MSIEIERKFLIDPDALDLELTHEVCANAQHIYQGYLCLSPEVRVRTLMCNDRTVATLTVKSDGGLRRVEVETSISEHVAGELLPLCVWVIQKTRFRLPTSNGRIWEVDRFYAALGGLWLAEIELGSADETFDRPPWLREEVTEDPRYKNKVLVMLKAPP